MHLAIHLLCFKEIKPRLLRIITSCFFVILCLGAFFCDNVLSLECLKFHRICACSNSCINELFSKVERAIVIYPCLCDNKNGVLITNRIMCNRTFHVLPYLPFNKSVIILWNTDINKITLSTKSRESTCSSKLWEKISFN